MGKGKKKLIKKLGNKDGVKRDLKKTLLKKPKKWTGLTNILLWTVIIYVGVFILLDRYGEKDALEPTISEVVASIKEGEIKSIIVRGIGVEVLYNDERVGELRRNVNSSFDETLINLGVTSEEFTEFEYSVKVETGFGYWFKSVLPFIFPFLLLVLFLWFFLKQSKGVGGMQIFQFGRSRARFIDPNDKENRITFADVAGSAEAKEELYEFVEFLKQPEKFLRIGAKVPKGVMLTGGPGTGKTLLARAVAGEAGVPFFSISGSEFVEMFVGVGASRVRDLFANAKKSAPAIVFIDEIDAVGRARGSGLGGGNDEREQALNQILVEMDGFEQVDKVIVMASTNRPDILDNALLRPGRFDRKVVVDLPDIKDRTAILKVHAKGKKFEDNVDLELVARRTPGMSGADLASVVNESAILAVRDSRKIISQNDLFMAIEKVILGPERKSYVITKREKKRIAYHEAGHALLASLLPYADPVQKITIVSRGHAGGYVLSLPDLERKLKTKKEFIDTITMALGGYVAEEMIFDDLSTGPSSDLSQVYHIAHNMVTQFGMSDAIGPVLLRQPSLGSMASGREEHSEELEKKIDKEIHSIIQDAYENAKTLLTKNKKGLELIVERLFEVETLEREEFEKLLSESGIVIQNIYGGEEEVISGK